MTGVGVDPSLWDPCRVAEEVGARARLTVLCSAHWPDPGQGGELEPVAGFVHSSFPPLVSRVAEECLRLRYGSPPVDSAAGIRTAVVLVSRSGDRETTEEVERIVDSGGRLSPLLFFQSVPNSIAGRVAARWGLTGPLACVRPTGDAVAEAIGTAELLLRDSEADQVLVVLVEQRDPLQGPGQAAAVLLGPSHNPRLEEAG